MGDLQRVGDGLRAIGETLAHFLLAGKGMARRQPAAIIFGNQPAFGDGEQRIVRFVILFAREKILIGGNQWQIARIGERDESGFGRFFLLHAVALKLDVKSVSKDTLQLIKAPLGRFLVVLPKRLANRSVGSSGERDQSVMGV